MFRVLCFNDKTGGNTVCAFVIVVLNEQNVYDVHALNVPAFFSFLAFVSLMLTFGQQRRLEHITALETESVYKSTLFVSA